MLMVMSWNSFERRAVEVEDVTLKIGGGGMEELFSVVDAGTIGVIRREELLAAVGSGVGFVIEQCKDSRSFLIGLFRDQTTCGVYVRVA